MATESSSLIRSGWKSAFHFSLY